MLEYFNSNLKTVKGFFTEATGVWRMRRNIIDAALLAEILIFPQKPQHCCRVLLSVFTESDELIGRALEPRPCHDFNPCQAISGQPGTLRHHAVIGIIDIVVSS